MTDSKVVVRQPDGTLKNIRNFALPVGADTVESQAVAIVDSADPTMKAEVGVDGLSVDVKALPATAPTAALQTTGNASLATIAAGVGGLPTGASTAARQDTGNASLSSIDGKIPELGQALEASSVPVVLTIAQLLALTPTAGGATSAKQDTIIGHLDGVEGLLGTIDADTGTLAAVDFATGADIATLLTDTQLRATPIPVSGTVTANPAPASSANNQGSTVSIPASNTLALAAFATRKGGTIYAPISNTDQVRISLGGTATITGIPLGPGESMPLNQGSGAYAGLVNALSESGTQALIVMEW